MLVTQAVALQSDSPAGLTNHGFNALNSNAVEGKASETSWFAAEQRLWIRAQVMVMPGKRPLPRWVRAEWPPRRATRDKSWLNLSISHLTSLPLFSHNTFASSGFFAPPFRVSDVNKSAECLMCVCLCGVVSVAVVVCARFCVCVVVWLWLWLWMCMCMWLRMWLWLWWLWWWLLLLLWLVFVVVDVVVVVHVFVVCVMNVLFKVSFFMVFTPWPLWMSRHVQIFNLKIITGN